MGIVERDLATFDLDGFGHCQIEQDTNGVIHLHIGNIRLELTPSEFDHIATVVGRGYLELQDGKDTNDVPSHRSALDPQEHSSSANDTELTDDQRRRILDTTEALSARDIPHVVLRSFTGLPERREGSDLDFLVAADRFGEAATVIQRRFEPAESRLSNVLDMAAYAARHPLHVARTILHSPERVVAFLRRKFVATNLGSRNYIERAFGSDGLFIHVVNHLAYRSPMDGSMIRVARSVEDGLLQRRTEYRGFPVPAPADELAHLVCRGVFDHLGTFPPRHRSRCDELVEIVFEDATATSTFESIMSELFYDASPMVTELVRSGEYDSIRPRLVSFDDY